MGLGVLLPSLTGILLLCFDPDYLAPLRQIWLGPLLIMASSLLLIGLLQGVLQHRKAAIKKILPYTLDLILVNIEAGLGLDGAVQRALAATPRPLREELSRVLHGMKQGKSRLEAWQELKERTPVAELNSLANAVIHASQWKLDLGQAIRDQAHRARQRHLHQVETQTQKVSLQTLFILLFSLLVTLCILIAPAAISLGK